MYYFIYKPTEIKFDTDDNYSNNYKNSNNNLHQKMQKYELFYNITPDEFEKNINDLQKLQINLQNYNDNYLPQLESTIDNSQIQASIQHKSISKLLTNRYLIEYLDAINKANATAYREYIKYKDNEKINIL